jgi:hypothetical protein
MKSLLTVAAVVEAATGVSLLVSPALPFSILFGAPLDHPTGVIVCRVGGAALVALGVACWRARLDGRSRGATGVVAALLFYNVAAVVILLDARLGEALGGIGLWPTVVLHAALTGWCIAWLRPANLS